jgi:hypothetical protein
MEVICLRAGKLRSYLEMDKLRMLRRTTDDDPIPDGGRASGRDIPSLHLLHGIHWWERVIMSYNQEMKMVGNLQKLW